MDQREKILRDALAKNLEETDRWELYKKENIQALENFDMFSKKLCVDIMVPIGKKAFITGHLIHTNEVLVSHYQGYFSKCSVYKASQICQHRLQLAQDHLEKLHTENELWQNKLNKPYLDGVVPNLEEHEIIEEYDEKKEKLWREQHKIRLREAKQHEKKEIVESKKQDELNENNDLMKILEEAELMEALENELEELKIKEGLEDEMLQKLISGKVSTVEKRRISHNSLHLEDKQENLPIIIKKSDLESHLPDFTNNNYQTNPELLQLYAEDNESDSSVSDAPEEVLLLQEQAKYLTPEDKIGFFQYHLQIINQKILKTSVVTKGQLNVKINLFKVRDHIEDLIEGLMGEGSIEDNSEECTSEVYDPPDKETSKKTSKNRRISFAVKDETLEFNRNETVANMILKSQTKDTCHRDVIHLDKTSKTVEQKITSDRQPTILNKVQNNLDFFSETQSLQDADVVNKIISSSMLNNHRTLRITFKHSEGNNSKKNEEYQHSVVPFTPRTPADLYEMIFPSATASNLQSEENNFKVPALKESDRSTAYTDLRTEFSKPESLILKNTEKNLNLRNKTVVEKEIRTETKVLSEHESKKPHNKKVRNPPEENYMTAYDKVMGDVVENNGTNVEPLPACKFIDVHTPKKRVSRFKQMRNDVT